MIKEFQGKYRWLSNFAPVWIHFEGLKFPSVEHAYMAAKSTDPEWKHTCAAGGYTAGQIKRLSKTVRLREDWDEKKIAVMREAIQQKFSQEPYLSLLLATGNEHIQEGNYWRDTFWGVCLKTGKGQNILGNLIMEVRSELSKGTK